MNTQTAQDILAARAAFAGTDAEFVAAQNVVTYTLKPGKLVGYGTFFLMFGEACANGVATWLSSNKPNFHTLYMAGNIDFGFSQTQALAADLAVNVEQVTPPVLEAILNLGRTSNPTQAERWGLETMVEADLEIAADVVAMEAIRETVNSNFNAAFAYITTQQNSGGEVDATTLKATLTNGL